MKKFNSEIGFHCLIPKIEFNREALNAQLEGTDRYAVLLLVTAEDFGL